MSTVESRLKDLGFSLPEAAPPAAAYVPYVVSGNLIFVAGQIPMLNGKILHQARVGDTYSIEQAQEAAQLCALNILAQAKAAVGDLERVTKVVKLTGFVQCTPEFTNAPEVINGASELIIKAFGKEVGSHARVAVGTNALPRGVSVEIDAIIEFRQ